MQFVSDLEWNVIVGGIIATVIASWVLSTPRFMTTVLTRCVGRPSGKPNWRDEPVTRKQIRKLVNLGVPRSVAENLTKGQAHDMISNLLNQ